MPESIPPLRPRILAPPLRMKTPTLDEVRAAQARIGPYLHRTPVLTSGAWDALAGAALFFKCENFQRSGSFKARGAHHAVFALSEAEARHGVVTHSSGNHGAALALAAHNRNVPAIVIVPDNALPSKIANIRRYGGRIEFCAPTLADREATTARVRAETGARLVHAYNDPWVIAGQGTAALELLEAHPDLDVIVAPVGGGGLLSGTAVAAKGLRPTLRVVGAEPRGADDAAQSLQAGKIIPQVHPQTIADGLRTSLGDLTFPLIQQHVDSVVTVSEEAIVASMRLVWSILKIVIEPSSAVAVAAVLKAKDTLPGQRVGIILSGGNVDLDHLPW
jgi:threonine dehydratase